VLELLGWRRLPQQEPGRGHKDIADELLFLSDEAKAEATHLRHSAERFRHGVVVVENEARDTPLDRASGKSEAPSSQVLRYLSRAETMSDGAVVWGLLTSGRFWRMYWAKAPARAEGFIEFDLPALLGDMAPPAPDGAEPLHWIKVFLLLFSRDALLPHGTGGETFLDEALAEGRHYEQRVTAQLSSVVFERVFPELMRAIVREAPAPRLNDPAWREEAREAGLRLLYRLLFLFYAEDRDLLPVRHDGYRHYALQGLREEAAAVIDQHRRLSPGMKTWWPKLAELFRAIADGNPDLGLPPYNGGLFQNEAAPMLASLSLPDTVLAPLLDAMSREEIGGKRRWINYRDLSVQHLGSIYERLLEQDLVADGAGGVALRPNAFSRKTTGSYYTPDELVRLILRRTVGPLLAERREAFVVRAGVLAGDMRPRRERLRELAASDPAEAFVALRICDPAMGSGHFLVSLVDYLAAEVLDAIAAAPALVPWAEIESPYRSPLMQRIETLRSQIRAQAAIHGWPIRDEQLDDRHLVRRIILKRVIHGVDLNPMAVELAKLSLWLHSFTVGAPLSFLDHHLRHGDSLFGELVGLARRRLADEYGLVSMGQAVVRASQSAGAMAMVEALADADMLEVKSSKEAFAAVEEATAELRAFLDLWQASKWLTPENPADKAARGLLFGGGYGDVVAIANGAPPKPPAADAVDIRKKNKVVATAGDAHAAVVRFLDRARALAAERRFLHWEAAFPGVWTDWEREAPPGGFDAVIGNPPWDRMKMQEVEWFAARVPSVALAQRASDRKRMITELRRKNDPVAAAYDVASATAEAAAAVARDGGAYPLLSGGDINLYSLFVERASRLVRPDGIMGLVVPSGIAADLGAAPYFRSVSTTGRLGALLDFENRRTGLGLEPFFPDVDTRFKFCALVTGGRERLFAQAECAFFQQDAVAAEANAFPLSPRDFDAVNPNTGTAPVFRSQRGAAIVKAIYHRLPVLVDHRGERPNAVWPVRYATMFHMTNDSDKFRTRAELEKDGAYPVAGQRWEKGDEKWLPLMTGRSINLFDHRAASVVENPANLHNPFSSALTTLAQHADPDYIPVPQFWVASSEVNWPVGVEWAVAFRDIARPTDARTIITSLVPKAGYGNKLPLLLPDSSAASSVTGAASKSKSEARMSIHNTYARFAPLMSANLASIVLDYIARQKVHGTSINRYIFEQLPVVPPGAFTRPFGPRTAEDIIREDVLHLTYTAHDMEPFARDQGYDGPPFQWDEEDRLRRRARLDAVFFHLYGLDRDEAGYVLSTFPIVKREEEARFQGRFRSRDLILAYMAALAAGAPDANVAG
jgi:hypothetical protein